MRYKIYIEILKDDENYCTLQSVSHDNVANASLDAICNIISLLELSSQKHEHKIIDPLINRLQELKK